MKDEKNAWVSRLDHTNQDQPMFRTYGETVGTNLDNNDIKCLAADLRTIRTGKENCWPYWIEGSAVTVGKELG